MSNKNVYKVCLTGGPCSGKTTALSRIVKELSPQFTIFSVPEVATMVSMSGVCILPNKYSDEDHRILTKTFCKMQINMEDCYEKMASLEKKKVVMICDRGVCDNFAYCSPENKEKILKEENWSIDSLQNERYDIVLHLVTSASGARDAYTKSNNTARWEDPEMAIKRDIKIQGEWMKHRNFHIIDNSVEGFDSKMQRVLDIIANLLGIQKKLLYHPQYLIENTFSLTDLPVGINYNRFSEEHYCLLTNSPSIHNSVSKITYEGNNLSTYLFSSDKMEKDVSKIQNTKKIIPAKMFNDYEGFIDQNIQPSFVDVVQFILKVNKQINLYIVRKISQGTDLYSVLEVVRDFDDSEEVEIPKFIKVFKKIDQNHTFHPYDFSTQLNKTAN